MHFRPCKAHFGDYYYCRIVGIFAKAMISREGAPHIFKHLSVRPLYILWIRCFTVSLIGISMPLSYVVDKSVLTTSLLSSLPLSTLYSQNLYYTHIDYVVSMNRNRRRVLDFDHDNADGSGTFLFIVHVPDCPLSTTSKPRRSRRR
jgi:hypothetical protein